MTAADTHDDPITDLPFPLASFPPTVAAWLEDTATQARVPVSFVAFPFLAFTGAVLGNQVTLQVGPGWIERPTLWVALVAPTGHGKTPAIAAARLPFATLHGGGNSLDALMDSLIDERDALLRAGVYDMTLDEEDTGDAFDNDLDDDLGLQSEGSPLFITTARIDYLTRALAGATGLCLMRDELASLIHTLDRGRSEDRLTLLSFWSSEPFYPHDPTLTPVLDPVLAIVGGFQPRLMHHLQGSSQDGLLERFLLVYPDSRPVPRPDPDLPAPDPEPILDLLKPLRPLDRTVVALSPDAAFAWRGWYHHNTAEVQSAGPTLDGFYRKSPSHVARIALVLHALWHPKELERPLAEPTIRHAIALAEYLRSHTRRVAADVGERGHKQSRVEALAQRTLAILAVESGWVTRTQLQQRLGRPETARFNRATDWLLEREAIEVSKEKLNGSDKPVTLYRQASHPAPNAANAGAR